MAMKRTKPALVLTALLATGVPGCKRDSAMTTTEAALRPTAKESAQVVDTGTMRAYEPGAWRSNPGQLNHTMLWLSHILVRHGEGADSQVSFTLTGWQTSQPPVTRTRDEALRRAQWVAREARSRGKFEELAREYSDEPETAERGGSIGGLIAGHLSAWPQVLDAVSTLEPGEVSDVVETPYGYHVLLRRAPVPEELVSGAHIVIAHANAPWLRLAARSSVSERTREQALALAAQIYEQARQKPDDFGKLAAEYSEHRDAARDGDFGTWSTRELTGYPREIETLTKLRIGEVSPPIDTLFGIQIIQRTANTPRARYAMSKVQIRFAADRPDTDPESKHAALINAREVAAILSRHPERFSSLQEQWHSPYLWEVIAGRDVPALEATLAALQPGQIAKDPIEDVDIEYLVPRREELSLLPAPPATLYDLPRAPGAQVH